MIERYRDRHTSARQQSVWQRVQNRSSEKVRTFLTLSIFLSGLSALTYEIAWQRVLVRLLGGTLLAITLTLVVFLGGLAIGAAAASSTCEKIRQPLKLFSWIELSLGAFGLLFPLLTTQASLNRVLDIVGWFVHLITHLDPITAYSTVSGGILINTSLAAATYCSSLARQ